MQITAFANCRQRVLLLGWAGIVGVLSHVGVGGGFLITPCCFFRHPQGACKRNQIVASSFSALLVHLNAEVDLRMGSVLAGRRLVGLRWCQIFTTSILAR